MPVTFEGQTFEVEPTFFEIEPTIEAGTIVFLAHADALGCLIRTVYRDPFNASKRASQIVGQVGNIRVYLFNAVFEYKLAACAQPDNARHVVISRFEFGGHVVGLLVGLALGSRASLAEALQL